MKINVKILLIALGVIFAGQTVAVYGTAEYSNAGVEHGETVECKQQTCTKSSTESSYKGSGKGSSKTPQITKEPVKQTL